MSKTIEHTHVMKAGRTDRAKAISQGLLEQVFERVKPSHFAVRFWDGEVLAVEGGFRPDFTIVLTHPGSLRRMLFPPGELTLAEAYLRGDFDIEGDMCSALALAEHFEALSPQDWLSVASKARSLPAGEPPHAYLRGRQRARLGGQRHSRARDRAAIAYHYDVGNDFYALFLGRWMAYSCAYFPSAIDLDTAQAAKFEHICRKLHLQPGDRLLDIGCGWGGLLLYAARHFGVQALGVTLSRPQVEYGQAWAQEAGLAEKVRIELRDYRDLMGLGPFDKVVSVGMFEHVGRRRLAEYFACAWRALKTGGLFLNHGIALQGRRSPTWFERTFFQRGEFSQRYVFPDGELVSISDALVFAEGVGFEVRDVESLREHYALTLRQWVKNLEGQRDRAIELTEERTYRTWRMFMAASAVGFENGQINVFQTLLSKNRGKTDLPLTRTDLYQVV